MLSKIGKSFTKYVIINQGNKKQNFCEEKYNHGHNIMRIFDVLPNFPFTTSETKPDYWYIRAASRVAEHLKTLDLRKLGKFRIMSKPHGSIT